LDNFFPAGLNKNVLKKEINKRINSISQLSSVLLKRSLRRGITVRRLKREPFVGG